MEFPGLCGGSAQDDSLNVNAECSVNLFARIPSGMAKAKPTLRGTPGLRPFCQVDDSPIRALFYQNSRTFAVGGATLFEILGENSFVSRGTVGEDDFPATICSNGTPGHQLFITSNEDGWIFDLLTNTLTQITDPQFPGAASMGDFVDGYFVTLWPSENTFYLSDLEDGTSWSPLMLAQRSLSSDPIAALIVVHREIWLLGQQRTEVWANSGDTFPFAPILSVGVIESGCLAPHSVCRVDNSIMWLGADERGAVQVMRADGYTPKVVSTPAVADALRRYANPQKAIAWAYQEAGHTFYVLYFPEGPDPSSGHWHTHWVFDASVPLEIAWHQRALWNTATAEWEPHIARAHCYDAENQLHLVGDRQNGVIYRQSLDIYDEQIVEP